MDQAALNHPGVILGKLSEVAYAKIVNLISTGNYGVNARLPSENELSEQLAVSRPIVREALARLREDGVVVSRRGSGTYLLSMQGTKRAQLGPLSSIDDMRDCLTFRRTIEGDGACHAAQRGGDLEGLEAALAKLEIGIAANEIAPEDDFAFHLAVAQHTGNRFYETAMRALHESVITSMSITRSFLMPRGIERVREVHEEHVGIVEAIRARDPDRARKSMHSHLDNVVTRAFGSSWR